MKNYLKTLIVALTLSVSFLACKKEPAVADFSYEIDGMKVKFTDNSTGEIEVYTWTFGDGKSSTDQNPTHEYSAAGTYTVSLSVDGNTSGKDAVSKTISIENTSTEEVTGNPSFTDANGVLYAINTSTYQMGVEAKIGSGLAVFPDGSGANLDAGTVSLNSNSLTKQTGNSYTWNSLSGSLTAASWSVGGGSGIPAFTEDAGTVGFPTISEITSGGTVTKSSGYTLSMSTVADADSVLFMIAGASGGKVVTKVGTTTSYTFTSAELTNVGTGSGTAQITAYKVYSADKSGKKIYFVNESVITKTVTIQ